MHFSEILDEEAVMTLDLTQTEARFLVMHLSRHIAHVENELVHTDDRPLKRSIAEDLEKLEMLRDRLDYAAAQAREHAA